MEGQPTDAVPPWNDWDEPAARRSSGARPPWLLVAGVAPWIVVVVLLLGRSGAAPAAEAGTEPAAAASPDAAPTRAPTAPTARVIGSAARTAVDEDDLRATATVVARAWLGGLGPRLELDLDGAASGDGYVEHLVVEGVDHPGPGAAVVTLLAVVLQAEGDRYDTAHLRRLAVPLHVDGSGARPAGTPYELTAPSLSAIPLEPSGDPLDAPELVLAAREALLAAGYSDVTVASLHRTAGWPLLATATARAPGASDAGTHLVWLREHLGELVVAGARPPRKDPQP